MNNKQQGEKKGKLRWEPELSKKRYRRQLARA
jgi:hypothetical protein